MLEVSIRSRNDAPSRKGDAYVVNGKMTKQGTQQNEYAAPLPPCLYTKDCEYVRVPTIAS